MFEKEIKIITDFSLEKIKKLGAYFTVEQLSQSGLHPSISQYINAELDFLIYLDRKELLQKSAFDYSNPEVNKYFDLITREIKNTKKLSFEDAKNLILQAVSFTANFLVRPKWSLTKFIFNEDQLKAVDEIKLSLNYLHYYDYLKNVITIYIEKKNTPSFSLIDFEVALNKIDKELFSTHSHKLIDKALLSISEFFSMSGIDPNKISPNCVELFLKEKDQIDYLFRLRRALPVNAKKYYDINSIRNIIYTAGDINKPFVLPSRDEEEIKIEDRKIPENLPNEIVPIIKPDEIPDKKIEDRKEPEIKIEDEQEVSEQGLFDFEENQGQETTEKMETEEKAERESEEILFDKEEESEPLEEETSAIAENKNNESDELDSLLEDEILSDISSGDDLLTAFDSQLKALEEESDSLLSDDEKLDEDNKAPIPGKEIKEENTEQIMEDKEGPKEESNSLLSDDEELGEDNKAPIPGKEIKEENIEQITEDKEEPKEESDSPLSGDEELHLDNESPIPETEMHEENIEYIKEEKSEPKIELEPEEQNIIEEDIEIENTEEVIEGDKQSEEPIISVESAATDKMKGKKDYKQVPHRERDLFSYLSNKEIEKVVTNVFNEDREDFANTMEKITECYTYDEATEILKGVFFSYRINPYTRDAVTLTNAVSNYFSQGT